MPQYRYQARHPSGQIRAGVLAADSATTAAAILRKQGHHLLQLVPVQSGQGQWANKVKALNYSSGPSQKDILDFTTQLAVMVPRGHQPPRRAGGHRRSGHEPEVQEDPDDDQDGHRERQAVLGRHRQVSEALRPALCQHGAQVEKEGFTPFSTQNTAGGRMIVLLRLSCFNDRGKPKS